jgi:putative transposase
MTRFRNVDGHQNGLGLCNNRIGHSRSPLRCGLLQNHCRDLRPGYDHLLRNLKAAQAVIASQSATFRRCYGPEYISHSLLDWAEEHGIALAHIQPGQPQQNAYIERYNRTVRHEWLDQYIIKSIEEAQHFATQWLWTFNNYRPNMGIGGITPAMKLKMAA